MLSSADGGRKMINGITFVESPFDSLGVLDIADHQFNIGVQVFRKPLSRPVNLWG